MQNLRALGAPLPNPRASICWGLCPQTPKTAPPLQISGYAPDTWLVNETTHLLYYFSTTIH